MCEPTPPSVEVFQHSIKASIEEAERGDVYTSEEVLAELDGIIEKARRERPDHEA